MKETVYLEYLDLYGQPSDRMQLEAALHNLDRATMLRLLSGISFSLDLLTGNSSEAAQKAAIEAFFPKPLASQIVAGGGVVFHRHQLLFLMQEVIKHCPDLGPPRPDSIQMGQLGQVFLMANEQLFSPAQPSGSAHDELLRLILDFLPISEANLFTSGLLKIARSHLMVMKFAEARRGAPGSFDIPALFYEATGVRFKTFEALMFGVFTRLVNVQQASKDPREFGIPVAYFDKLPIETTEISAFFRAISATPEEYAAGLLASAPRPNDFRVIRDKPLLRIAGHCFPLDAHSGFEKFETSVYWSILGHLPDERKKSFPSFWGTIFEDYVLWLLAESVDAQLNRLHSNPKYAHDAQREVCDAIVVCGRTAIFIEIKGNTITSEGKYGSDVDRLRNELEKKYVGTEDNRKGVRQLAAAIHKTCSRAGADAVGGVDLNSISTVIPVLITRDDIGGYFVVNAYLNARFKELMGRTRYQKSITPCVCMCSDTLEKLTPYFCDTSFADILSSRIRNDKTLRAPFFARIGSVLRRKNKGGSDRQPTLLKEATFAVVEVAREVYGAAGLSAGAG
jgi:hypothetical protein